MVVSKSGPFVIVLGNCAGKNVFTPGSQIRFTKVLPKLRAERKGP